MPSLGFFATSGGTDPATHFITPRRVSRGWPGEMEPNLQALIRWQPDMFMQHLFAGTFMGLGAMELDGLPYARANHALKLVTDESEMVATFVMLHLLMPSTVFAFYAGSPEHSPIFTQAQNAENYVGIDQRLDSSIRPILKMRDRGVPVALWIDAASIRDKDSLTAHCHQRIWKHHGIPCGTEARLTETAEWLNRDYVPVVAWRNDWHQQANWPGVIPEDKLRGPQYLICNTEEEAGIELAAGRNVLLNGIPSVFAGTPRPDSATSRPA